MGQDYRIVMENHACLWTLLLYISTAIQVDNVKCKVDVDASFNLLNLKNIYLRIRISTFKLSEHIYHVCFNDTKREM